MDYHQRSEGKMLLPRERVVQKLGLYGVGLRLWTAALRNSKGRVAGCKIGRGGYKQPGSLGLARGGHFANKFPKQGWGGYFHGSH
eukprot:594028-Hanusia_phi.AAC.1